MEHPEIESQTMAKPTIQHTNSQQDVIVLDKLPNEMIETIASFQTTEDFCNLRLVNKTISNATIIFL